MSGHSSGENSSVSSKEERRQLYQAAIVTLADSSRGWQQWKLCASRYWNCHIYQQTIPTLPAPRSAHFYSIKFGIFVKIHDFEDCRGFPQIFLKHLRLSQSSSEFKQMVGLFQSSKFLLHASPRNTPWNSSKLINLLWRPLQSSFPIPQFHDPYLI